MTSIDTRKWGDDKRRKCSICHGPFIGMGNNAEPFDGRCCDDCNRTFVITARILQIKNRESKTKK